MGLISRKANTVQTRWRSTVSGQHPSGSWQARTDSCLDPSSDRTGCAHQGGVRAWLITGRTDGVKPIVDCWFLIPRISEPFPSFISPSAALHEDTPPPPLRKQKKKKELPSPVASCYRHPRHSFPPAKCRYDGTLFIISSDIVLLYLHDVVDAYNCI